MIRQRLDHILEHKIWPYALLAAATFAAYANVYTNDFLFDDDLLIRLNHLLRGWDTAGSLLTTSTTEGARIVGGFYRPLQNILYFIIFQLGGETKFGFHLLNIALHIGNVCLGYALGRKLGLNSRAVFFGILIWALHPLHTEAVTYMSATADPLFVFFCLWGLVILAPDFVPKKIFAVIPLFLLALFSKETAVVFPLLVMCCLYFVSAERLSPKTYLRTWPLWVITGVYVFWRATAPGFDGPQTYDRLYQLHDFYNLKLYAENPSWRIYTFLATLPAYLKLLVWPMGLRLERSFIIFSTPLAWLVAGGFLIAVAALAQIIWSSKKGHERGLTLSWGLLWFAAAHAPDTGLLVAMNALFLEHWMYLPTLGLFLGIAQTIYTRLEQPKWVKFRPAAAGVALIVALICGARTYDQNAVWHDPVTFYTHIFNYGEISARAHNNLALAYMDRHEVAKAIEEFKLAIAISDSYAETRFNYALALMNLPDQRAHIPEAIDNLNRSLEIDPNFYRSYDTLAKIYDFIGEHDKAVPYRQKADELMAKSGQ
jgi:tetratricopeptide (TPR) repeat protein